MSSSSAYDWLDLPKEPDGPYILVMARFPNSCDSEEAVRYRYEFGRRWWPPVQKFRALADGMWRNMRVRKWCEMHPETRHAASQDDDIYIPPECMRYTMTLDDGTPVDVDAPNFQYSDMKRITVLFHEEAYL